MRGFASASDRINSNLASLIRGHRDNRPCLKLSAARREEEGIFRATHYNLNNKIGHAPDLVCFTYVAVGCTLSKQTNFRYTPTSRKFFTNHFPVFT
jgi:hypothetical protein